MDKHYQSDTDIEQALEGEEFSLEEMLNLPRSGEVDAPDVLSRLASLKMERQRWTREVRRKRPKSLLVPGLKIGMLTLVRTDDREGFFGAYNNREWVCRCDCGKEVKETYVRLYHATAYSCGCTNKPRKKTYMNLSGQKFGRLTVGDWITAKGWLCVCECGQEEFVRFSYLLTRTGAEKCPHLKP